MSVDNIKELADKLLNGTISDQELASLEKWFNTNPDSDLVWNLKDNDKEELANRILNTIPLSAYKKKGKLIYLKQLAAAAVFVAVSTALYFGINYYKSANNVTQNIVGISKGIKKVILPDHSIVWLKGDSKIEYPSTFSDSTRNVTLHGEALFEVAKDKSHPFIIKAGKYVTKVLGTSFNIKQNEKDNSFHLVVLTGKVLVTESTTLKTAQNKPVSHLIESGNFYESNTQKSLAKIGALKVEMEVQAISGTEYDMNFEDASFDNIKNKIQQKFNVDVIATNGNYASCFISADLTDQSLENTLKVLCSVIGANYQVKENQIILTGGGCN